MKSQVYSNMCNCIDLNNINHLFNPHIEFLNEAKICIKLHQFSKNWSCFTCCSLCVKGFPSVPCLCRKGVFPGCWLADSSVVFCSDVLSVG